MSKLFLKLIFYDYIGNNPTKWRSFRVASIDNRDGIAIGWLGLPIFRDKEGCKLFVRSIPIFFEIFLIILIDDDKIILYASLTSLLTALNNSNCKMKSTCFEF